jgi:hypothetical protein
MMQKKAVRQVLSGEVTDDAEKGSIALVDSATSIARGKARATLKIEQNLAKLDSAHYRAWQTNETCEVNAHTAFSHFMDSSGVGAELTADETAHFEARFVEEMLYDCKHHDEDAATWLIDIGVALEEDAPVVTEQLVASLNNASMGFHVSMRPWMMLESRRSLNSRCGKEGGGPSLLQTQARDEEHTGQTTQPPSSFDTREHWPSCAETIGRIHNQGTCGSCWVFGALSAVDSRICIATDGAFQSNLAQISRGFSTSCSRPGRNGCLGGLARHVFDHIAETGVPTGGSGNVAGCSHYFASGDGEDHFDSSIP